MFKTQHFQQKFGVIDPQTPPAPTPLHLRFKNVGVAKDRRGGDRWKIERREKDDRVCQQHPREPHGHHRRGYRGRLGRRKRGSGGAGSHRHRQRRPERHLHQLPQVAVRNGRQSLPGNV